MRSDQPYRLGVPVAVVAVTALGILILCAATWAFWRSGLGSATRVASLTPVLFALLVQGAMLMLALRGREVRPGALVGLALGSLVLLVVVGGILSEVIHCSFDRMGCINL